MADDALQDSSETWGEDEILPTPQELRSERVRLLDASRREDLRRRVVPYGVDTLTKTFYFGLEIPTESSWEISGEWVENADAILITTISVFPSRRVFDSEGDPGLRDSGSFPGVGLNRDIMRRLGSDAPIRRAIERQKDAESAAVVALAEDESELPDWAVDLVDETRNRRRARSGRGNSEEWWIARADEYLAVAKVQGTKYGVQAQLADDQMDEYWGVPIAGTRYRVGRLRERGLIDDSGPIPQPGKNHPLMKEKTGG